MKKLLVVFILVLSGCASNVAVTRHFPDVPDDLKQSCPALDTVDNGTDKLSDVVTVVSKNYSKYYDCKDQVDAWNEWYITQKKIFESVK